MNKAFTLQDLADFLDAELRGDPQCQILRLNTLRDAGDGDLAFLANPVYGHFLSTSKAGAVILDSARAEHYKGNTLVVADPYLAYARLSQLFDTQYQLVPGVHPSATLAASVELGDDVQIGAQAVIGEHVIIGARTYIGPGVVIGDDCHIGDGCYLHANATLYGGVYLGAKVIVHSGAVIGADGFGFAASGQGWEKIYQLGGVVVGDNVEIGAGTTIDRGALGNTVIGHGVIIDNLVQIAHNVRVGDNCALAGCAAIAGSTVVGRNCVLAGGAGLVGHIELCDGVTVTARSLITKSIKVPGVYSSGTPFADNAQWKKNAARFGQLDKIAKKIAQLAKGREE